ncbi:MAG: histone deacetylase [Candidatus Diapherotrites archaeon]
MKLFYSPRFLEHNTFRHPECSERLTAIIGFLKKQGFSERDFVEPKPALEEDVLLVHEQSLLDELKLRSKRLLSVPDNPFNENTYELALLSAGSAFGAARACGKEFAFSLGRPPGHHAGIRTFGGFCYLNNIAFAVRKAQREGLAKKVLIVDFDVHLGQGTLEIFQSDSSVFYLSFHQNPNTIYPWQNLGFEGENIKKVDFLPGARDEEFLRVFKQETLAVAKAFKPDMVAVSAGFDIFFTDSMVGNALEVRHPETFFEIGKTLKSLKKPCFGVLEGGYDLKVLGENVFNFLKAFI